ncbi:MAG TPA: amino acid permease, partial [Candidatus Thermoplasmatota archaeon]|nr:amino acid permease [Candidatus Thermoplasmatota archaeon]
MSTPEAVALPQSDGKPAPAAEEVRLSRDMSLLDATMLGVGALMGGGVFVLVGIATGVAGPAVLLAFALNGLITIPTLMVYAELGSAYHDAGGGYLWVKESLGQPWGFMSGWISWFSHAVACALYSIASASYVLWLLKTLDVADFGTATPYYVKGLAVFLALSFVALNYVGTKHSVKTENAINVVVLFIVLGFIGLGLHALTAKPDLALANFADFFPTGPWGVALAMGITFISFEGYEIISQSSEEIKNPKRNIPRAIFLTMAIVLPIYLLVVLITVGTALAPAGMPAWVHLGNLRENAVVEVAGQMVAGGAIVLVGVALLLQLTALNATIYSSSRVSFAMGRDGNLPSFFGKIHPHRRTPHLSVWGSGVIIMGMALLPIEAAAAAADIMFLLLFLLVNVSYIKLRNTLPKESFGYRAPLFPILPVLGILSQIGLAIVLFSYHPAASLSSFAWLGLGLAFYYLYTRPREHASGAIKPRLRVLHESPHPPLRDYRILVPISNPANADALASAAKALAKGLDGEVLFLYVVQVPDVTPLTEGEQFVARARPIFERAETVVGNEVPLHTL